VKEVAVVQRDAGPMDHVMATLTDIARMLKGRTEEQQPKNARKEEVGSREEQGRGPAGDNDRRQGQGQWGWGRGAGRGQWPAAGKVKGSGGPPHRVKGAKGNGGPLHRVSELGI
jgi:hypothetical protein